MPGFPITTHAVVEHLAGLTERLDNAVKDLAWSDQNAAQLRHQADLAESMAFVGAEGSMELRRHLARIAAADIEGEAVVAESVVRHSRAVIRALELEIEVGRSYGAVARAEMAALPYDPHA